MCRGGAGARAGEGVGGCALGAGLDLVLFWGESRERDGVAERKGEGD